MATHPSYPCLGDSQDRGAWRGTVHGVTESNTAKRVASSSSLSSLPLLVHTSFSQPTPSAPRPRLPLPEADITQVLL